MSFSRTPVSRPNKTSGQIKSTATSTAVRTGTSTSNQAAKKPVVNKTKVASSTKIAPTITDFSKITLNHGPIVADDENEVEASFDEDDSRWEEEMKSRSDFLHQLMGNSSTEASSQQQLQYPSQIEAAATAAAAQSSQRSKPLPADDDEIRGLDDDDEVPDIESTSAHYNLPITAASNSSHPSSSKTILVPSLFDLAVEALGLNYHAIAAQDVSERLPPGTLQQAIVAVRKAGLLTDHHIPLLFRTLTSSANVNSRTWLEEDCGLDSLISSKIEIEEDSTETAPSPSLSPPPSSSSSATIATTTAAKSTLPKKSKPSPSPVVATPAANVRFAPLRGTPGITSLAGHSMNTATLARAEKAAKLAAQIAAENVQPRAKPRVKEQTAQVKSVRLTKRDPNVIPKDYIIESGELLDLHAQHKISTYGFKLLTSFMSYTKQSSTSGSNGMDDDVLGPSAHGSSSSNNDHSKFTPEQQQRLAAAGVNPELLALVRSLAPHSTVAKASSMMPQAANAEGIPHPVIELANRLGIWRPVNIICLDISYSSIDTPDLQLIARQCPNLLKVNICGCEKLTNLGLSDLSRHCRSIQVLLMEVLPCLDDSAIQDVIHGLRQLLTLDVGSCRKLTNVSFQMIGTHGKTLKRLSAAGCLQTTDFDIEDLSLCVSLLSLSLRACGRITDDAVTHLVALSKRKKKVGMRGLQHLDLGGCVRLSDGSINALCAAYKDSLTHLDLRGLTRLTNRCLDAVMAHCYKQGHSNQLLQELNLQACTGITPDRIELLRQSWTNLKVIV